MFSSTISIAVPLEHRRRPGVVKTVLRFLLGGPGTSREKTLVHGTGLLRQLIDGLEAEGYADAVNLFVDGKAAFADDADVSDDVSDAFDAAQVAAPIQASRKPLRLLVSREHAGLHILVEARILGEHEPDEHALVLSWCARLTDLRVQPDELPGAYRARVLAWLAGDGMDDARALCARLVNELATSLDRFVEETSIQISPLKTQIVVPGPDQLGRCRHLGFGDHVRPVVYSALPRARRHGAYDQPHVHHAYDPYHDLLCWLFTLEALEGRMNADGVVFVDRFGATKFVLPTVGLQSLDVPRDAIGFTKERLNVHDSLPHVGFDIAEAGSPHAPGYGGGGA
ncbi:MAG: hypothetical protein AAGA54_35550 [Myxococcota bacterium]